MLATLLLLAVTVAGQTPASPSPDSPNPTPTPNSPAPVPDYAIGPGDVLEVTVFGNDDLSRTATVQTNGAVALPILGDLSVGGLSVAEVKQKVTTLLKDYLVRPQIEVRVKEYHSQFVSVVGEVNSPGRKVLRGRTRLIDLLVEAGGFTPRASGDVVITRTEGAFEGGAKALHLRLSGVTLTAQDQVNLQVPLKNEDIITASPKFYVTVEGEVTRPGRYAIEGELTVLAAISEAGGLTRFGSNDVKIRRLQPETGKIQMVEVNLKDIRNGKKQDPPLQPSDVVYVPRKRFIL